MKVGDLVRRRARSFEEKKLYNDEFGIGIIVQIENHKNICTLFHLGIHWDCQENLELIRLMEFENE